MVVLRTLAEACGPSLVDVHADADHHRSVFTLAGPGTARRRRRAPGRWPPRSPSTSRIVGHEGEHPRFGALDVVPFVALGGTNVGARAGGQEAQRIRRVGGPTTTTVPVFLYDDADPSSATSRTRARMASSSRRPDFGPERAASASRRHGRRRPPAAGRDQRACSSPRHRRGAPHRADDARARRRPRGVRARSGSSFPSRSARRCR